MPAPAHGDLANLLSAYDEALRLAETLNPIVTVDKDLRRYVADAPMHEALKLNVRRPKG